MHNPILSSIFQQIALLSQFSFPIPSPKAISILSSFSSIVSPLHPTITPYSSVSCDGGIEIVLQSQHRLSFRISQSGNHSSYLFHHSYSSLDVPSFAPADLTNPAIKNLIKKL